MKTLNSLKIIKNINDIKKKTYFMHKTFCTKVLNKTSTIYALSSGQGKCGVAVIRISGSDAELAIKKMTNISNLKARQVYLRSIKCPENGEIIDRGLCLWFPEPYSFTGENSVEFQVHGGSAILSSIMSALSKLNFRPALPGEFTKRAFLNNKLDLTEIEGLADLIHAETEQQRRQALLQAHGSLSSLYNKWRSSLLHSLANIEAYIDFGEEENIESNILKISNNSLKKLALEMQKHLSDGRKGEILRDGIRTTIIGEPNVGKSSLLNYLVQKNAAIVTAIPGTTRDVVELTVNISGYPIILADTAGLNKFSNDIVELEGIRRAREKAKESDFIILVMNAVEFLNFKKSFNEYLQFYIKKLSLENLLLEKDQLVSNCIIVMNKMDLIDLNTKKELQKYNTICISCTKEEGFDELLNSLSEHFKLLCGNPNAENPTISQERHRNHVQCCHGYILAYLQTISFKDYDMVLAAQEIRKAARELGKITGQINSEEVLDIIFKSFCVGK